MNQRMILSLAICIVLGLCASAALYVLPGNVAAASGLIRYLATTGDDVGDCQGSALLCRTVQLQQADSIPRFARAKFFQEGERLKVPLDVQGHHALIDGVHVGKSYAHVQDDLDQPEVVLGQA